MWVAFGPTHAVRHHKVFPGALQVLDKIRRVGPQVCGRKIKIKTESILIQVPPQMLNQNQRLSRTDSDVQAVSTNGCAPASSHSAHSSSLSAVTYGGRHEGC